MSFPKNQPVCVHKQNHTHYLHPPNPLRPACSLFFAIFLIVISTVLLILTDVKASLTHACLVALALGGELLEKDEEILLLLLVVGVLLLGGSERRGEGRNGKVE